MSTAAGPSTEAEPSAGAEPSILPTVLGRLHPEVMWLIVDHSNPSVRKAFLSTSKHTRSMVLSTKDDNSPFATKTFDKKTFRPRSFKLLDSNKPVRDHLRHITCSYAATPLSLRTRILQNVVDLTLTQSFMKGTRPRYDPSPLYEHAPPDEIWSALATALPNCQWIKLHCSPGYVGESFWDILRQIPSVERLSLLDHFGQSFGIAATRIAEAMQQRMNTSDTAGRKTNIRVDLFGGKRKTMEVSSAYTLLSTVAKTSATVKRYLSFYIYNMHKGVLTGYRRKTRGPPPGFEFTDGDEELTDGDDVSLQSQVIHLVFEPLADNATLDEQPTDTLSVVPLEDVANTSTRILTLLPYGLNNLTLMDAAVTKMNS